METYYPARWTLDLTHYYRSSDKYVRDLTFFIKLVYPENEDKHLFGFSEVLR